MIDKTDNEKPKKKRYEAPKLIRYGGLTEPVLGLTFEGNKDSGAAPGKPPKT